MSKTPTFIEIYDNVLSHEQCKQIITEFELDKINHQAEKCGDGVVENVKKSTDIIHYLNDDSLASSIINFALAQPLDHYKKNIQKLIK